MQLPFYVERPDVIAAQALISEYGTQACAAAADRAVVSRNQGNYVQFCRWRQIERLVTLLTTRIVLGALH